MDWLRSCYYSSHRLFRGRPDVVTRGRYYFTTNPFLPFPHIYGSLNWWRGELYESPQLGELLDAPRPYFNGAWDGPPVGARVIGQPACLTTGDTYPPSDNPPIARVNGVDSRCLDLLVLPMPVRAVDWDPTNASIQLISAQVLDWMYRDPFQPATVLPVWLGPGATVTVVQNSSDVVPGTVTIQTPTYTVVFISGTSNRQQFALQALGTVSPQLNTGLYSTSFFWQQSTDAIHLRLVGQGVNPALPIVIIGDSYGGALATLLAATYQSAQPGRGVRLLTFGMPKPGDARVDVALGSVRRVHIVNDTDPVPDLPPDLGPLAYLVGLLPGELLARWALYRSPGERHLLDAQGVLRQSSASTLAWSFLLYMVDRLTTGQPLDWMLGHSMQEYLRRLRLTAPVPAAWPVDSATRALLVDPLSQYADQFGELIAGGDIEQFT